MLQIYKKIHRFCGVLSYFNNGKWAFTCDNVKVYFKYVYGVLGKVKIIYLFLEFMD